MKMPALLVLALVTVVYARGIADGSGGSDPIHSLLSSLFLDPPKSHSLMRRILGLEDQEREGLGANADEFVVEGLSAHDLKTSVNELRLKLQKNSVTKNDLLHERYFLEKSLELKRGQKTMQDGQVKLSQAELEDKAREIARYKREVPKTLSKYNELVRRQQEMQDTLNRLHKESEDLSLSKNDMLNKLQHLNMEDLIERHARALPEAMAGALRKSASVLIPFFDTLMIAADTNNRLVDHVGAEIDKYTHVNVGKSPFMSGVLFYCVLLVPLLTLISFFRRIFDSSSKLTVSHFIIFGNLYFMAMCIMLITSAAILQSDPMVVLFKRYERSVVIVNLLLALYYAWHVSMLGLQTLYSFERRNASQLIATICVGIHYFIFTWRRVFTDAPPLMYSHNYLMYATIFGFVTYERCERINAHWFRDNYFTRWPLRKVIPADWRTFLASCDPLKWFLATFAPASLAASYKARRYSKRHDRRLVNANGANTSRVRGGRGTVAISPGDSDDDDCEAEGAMPSNTRHHRRSSKDHRRESPQRKAAAEQRGFVSIFFGSREDEEYSTDGEEANRKGAWRILGGGGVTRRSTPATVSARTGQSIRTTTRARKQTRAVTGGLWTWS